jgi:hypothetical protein
MPVMWVIAPYKRYPADRPIRVCAMNDFNTQIFGDGGDWAESECLGDQAVVKVSASVATLNLIAAAPGFVEVPRKWARLADGLGTMTAGERNALQTRLLNAGFSQAEIDGRMGASLAQWRGRSLNDLLGLLTARRLKPRYDATLDRIIVDGPPQPTRPVAEIDALVTEG